MNTKTLAPLLPAAALALVASAPAHAYIGPGVGLGVVGTVFGIVATLALAIFGFLWYPAKRLLAKRRAAGAAEAPAARTASAPEPAPALESAAADPAPAPAAPTAPVDARSSERDGA